MMTCPECEGHKMVEVSTPVKHPRDLDCNDWYTESYPCETCQGTGEVESLSCDECGITIDASNMETAGKVGDDLLCLDCRMAEAPCPECCGAKGREVVVDVCGGTVWRECDGCHGSGRAR
jgi:RecJ-like exonuclease